MPTSTTNYGLIKPGTDDPILIGQLNDNMDTIDTVLKDHSDKIDAAALGIKYKGEVNYYADLPNSAEIGDAYTVKYAGSSGTTPDGTEYVWGTVSGTNQWINFSKDSYTKAEVDALLKQNALTTAQLAAVNSGIDSTKVAQIEINKNNISAAYGGLVDKNKFNIYNLDDINNLTVDKATGVCTQVTDDTRDNLMFGVWKGSSTVISPTTITTNGIYHYSFQKNAGDTTIRFGHNGAIRNAQITYDISDFDNGTYVLQLNIINCVQADGKYSWNQVMICSQADYNADTTYQPYAMSNAELTAAIQAIQAQLANQ